MNPIVVRLTHEAREQLIVGLGVDVHHAADLLDAILRDIRKKLDPHRPLVPPPPMPEWQFHWRPDEKDGCRPFEVYVWVRPTGQQDVYEAYTLDLYFLDEGPDKPTPN